MTQTRSEVIKNNLYLLIVVKYIHYDNINIQNVFLYRNKREITKFDTALFLIKITVSYNLANIL